MPRSCDGPSVFVLAAVAHHSVACTCLQAFSVEDLELVVEGVSLLLSALASHQAGRTLLVKRSLKALGSVIRSVTMSAAGADGRRTRGRGASLEARNANRAATTIAEEDTSVHALDIDTDLPADSTPSPAKHVAQVHVGSPLALEAAEVLLCTAVINLLPSMSPPQLGQLLEGLQFETLLGVDHILFHGMHAPDNRVAPASLRAQLARCCDQFSHVCWRDGCDLQADLYNDFLLLL